MIEKIQIQENRFGFEPEITAMIAKLNCLILRSVFRTMEEPTRKESRLAGEMARAIYCII